MSALSFLVEYARAGLLLVTPELAAAGFSGIDTGKVRGGIDDGNVRFGDAGFVVEISVVPSGVGALERVGATEAAPHQ